MTVSALAKEPSVDLGELIKLEHRFLTLTHEGSEVAERLTKEAQQDISRNCQYPGQSVRSSHKLPQDRYMTVRMKLVSLDERPGIRLYSSGRSHQPLSKKIDKESDFSLALSPRL